ncbi:MAG: NADH-quinone oxidoreductase subunit J [Chloroflexi bacterium]|nr:NADH-quinone oxidoreductase subunit J [Chloroflexota bacterium]
MGNPIVFLILAGVAIVAAIMMVTSRNAVYSALWLVLNFSAIAIFYLLLNAPFIAMVQITVYAGAIMVLFLFVIMLLGAEQLRGVTAAIGGERWQQALAVFSGLLLLGTMGILLFQGLGGGGDTAVAINSSPAALGVRLFEVYTFPFELTGVLLLTAMIGVAIFSFKKKKRERS